MFYILVSITTNNLLTLTSSTNQALSQANACGNGFMPYNVGCQNTASQIQGDDNAAALASEQSFEEHN